MKAIISKSNLKFFNAEGNLKVFLPVIKVLFPKALKYSTILSQKKPADRLRQQDKSLVRYILSERKPNLSSPSFWYPVFYVVGSRRVTESTYLIREKTNLSWFTFTSTLLPRFISPERILRAKVASTSFWIILRSGLAP